MSKVQSLAMDAWTDEQLARVQNGGNAKSIRFFKSSFIKYALQLHVDNPHTDELRMSVSINGAYRKSTIQMLEKRTGQG